MSLSKWLALLWIRLTNPTHQRDGHPPSIKFTEKLLLLEGVVCSDRYLLEALRLGWRESLPPRGSRL